MLGADYRHHYFDFVAHMDREDKEDLNRILSEIWFCEEIDDGEDLQCIMMEVAESAYEKGQPKKENT